MLAQGYLTIGPNAPLFPPLPLLPDTNRILPAVSAKKAAKQSKDATKPKRRKKEAPVDNLTAASLHDPKTDPAAALRVQ